MSKNKKQDKKKTVGKSRPLKQKDAPQGVDIPLKALQLLRNKWFRYAVMALSVVLGVTFLSWFVPASKGFYDVPSNLSVPVGENALVLRWYTIFVLVGLLTAMGVFHLLQKSYAKLEKVDVWEALIFMLIPGVMFARFYYVWTTPIVLESNPLAWLQFGQGGLSIIGGFFGGLLGLYVFARWRKLHFYLIVNAIAVVLPLAQAIGRWGNFFNRELLGQPTDLPWGMFVPYLARPLGYEGSQFFHPIFLYESLASLVLFLVLAFVWKHKAKVKEELEKTLRAGFFVKIYLAWYLTVRFWLDFYRIDGSIRPSGLTITQWLTLGLFAGVIVFSVIFQLWFRYTKAEWFTRHEQLA